MIRNFINEHLNVSFVVFPQLDYYNIIVVNIIYNRHVLTVKLLCTLSKLDSKERT